MGQENLLTLTQLLSTSFNFNSLTFDISDSLEASEKFFLTELGEKFS